ncbi:hypothetical protein COT75_02220 [Candidatus Beckwithbacteria bacterium CG10_big_fil_rev_8_21_14_0_10_34_10]|uniref:Glycosyltransferase RgtA/B/C/D-like domain-containing protein n=1 Tax=Candidatus Beckwithbacteria bacterium CG10_big_fil_rev_8_21_14_0_10_34_10 TaxID=1974495 RepID=A0A2H0WBL9_9BACT|nr:MAG: hypothetical protein COT75_02220 [Candidatus Beckwithbacteria bacterium CG10_big_fil_rev_8_21_14_0_10_34_10]
MFEFKLIIRNKKWFLIFFLVLVWYLQSKIPLWRGHLEIDVWDYYNTISLFLKNQSFASLKGNEILPGGLLFFLFPLLLSINNFTYLNFLNSFVVLNLILLLLHFLVYEKNLSYFKLFPFLLILLVSGPILLFRFELFVSLIVILSILFWQKKRFFLSVLLLGIATTIKLYPIFFLPYFLYLGFINFKKEKQLTSTFFLLVYFFLGALLPLFIFTVFGGRIEQFIYSLSFHSEKPLSIESIFGSIFIIFNLALKGMPPPLLGTHGLWGLNWSSVKPQWLNLVSLFPLGFLYFYIFFKTKIKRQLSGSILFLIILFSLVFSKNLHPQYFFWFIFLMPFIKTKKGREIEFFKISFLVLITILLTQCLYPLLYTQLIEGFFKDGRGIEIFYLLLLRNISFLTLVIFSFHLIGVKKNLE